MAKRPKLRMTNADYVAIAVSPALIMALVGSLVFFLIEVMYVGQYTARLNYVFALFVFATVLIGRISIEMGADRAALFALPLGGAMFMVLAKFVEHASSYSHLINIALLGIVWWSTHKLTWDCTLIDDSEDASGEGLMQRVGFDELTDEHEDENEVQSGATDNELLTDEPTKKKKRPHTPGLWVLYFSLAALPLFGIGQKWIPAADVGRRQYAFGLLAVYVAAGLALLVTTSFLGLRRYLRQRRVEMPAPMAATWVVTGVVLIGIVMLLAALIPRPQAEYAISQVPWEVGSPSELASSRNNFGDEGTEDDEAGDDSRKVLNEETDPNAAAKREGDNPTATSEDAEKQTSGESKGQGEDSSEGESKQGEKPDSSESGKSEPSSESEANSSESNSGEQQSSEQSSDQRDKPSGDSAAEEQKDEDSRTTKAPAAEANETQAEQPADSSSNVEPAAEPARPLPSISNLMPSLGGLAGLLKLVFYAVVAFVLGFLAWRHREQIARAIADFVREIRDFLAQLFGGKRAEPTSAEDDETEQVSGPPPRAFAAFADPFASGQHRSLPPDELVRYTFEAFEAWARERGHPRSPDQTPLELIRRAIPHDSPVLAEAQRLARLYNEAAYAPKSVSASSVEKLARLWELMNRAAPTPQPPPTPQTPVESAP